MKKILSIAAVSFISTAILSVNVNASCDDKYSFESYKTRLNSSMYSTDTITSKAEIKCDDNILQELLNDCYTKYFDNCIPNGDTNGTQKPDNDNNKPDIESKPETDKPSKPENDNGNGGNQNNNNQGGNTDSAINSIIQQVIDLVNKERKAAGLPLVNVDNVKLGKAASVRAQEQASNFSHTRPNGSSWTTVLTDFGISYRTAGENVAYGQKTALEVMNAWMNSAGHRANILNSNYKEIGVGVYYKNGTYYWSQIFVE